MTGLNDDDDTQPGFSWPSEQESFVILTREDENSEPTIVRRGVPFEFSTPFFSGHVLIRSRGDTETKQYFDGGRKQSSVIVTGVVKQPVSFDSVFTGQEFPKPVAQPNYFLHNAVLGAFKLLAPLLHVNLGSDSAHFLSPVVQTVQRLHISDEPFDLQDPCVEVTENTLQLGNEALCNNDPSVRKKYFSNASNLSQHSFLPDKYYTFEFFDETLNLENFTITILGQKINVAPYLCKQPLRILTRVGLPSESKANVVQPSIESPSVPDTGAGSISSRGSLNGPMWNFEIWHRSLFHQ